MIAAIAFAVAPVQAGNGGGKDKKNGGINPTNVVIVESDFDTLAATTSEPDGTGGYLWTAPSTDLHQKRLSRFKNNLGLTSSWRSMSALSRMTEPTTKPHSLGHTPGQSAA